MVLDLPSDMDLEQVCQELFDLGRAQPGLRLSLTTPAEGPLAEPDAMGLALEDVSALGVGWWHVPSRALLAGSDDVLWFERVGRFLRGISLDDVAGGEGGLPPGLGALDLPRLAELTGRAVEATLDTDPIPDPALLSSAVDSLLAAGFR
ncbi:MAG: hypothetical protein DRQ55_12090 [Planctomycetota bacterium]|nr:MAG: hypothetical protein DRQ55_12090 [Planctomycetota bacterium]